MLYGRAVDDLRTMRERMLAGDPHILVWLGGGAIVPPGVPIGANTVVGAGAVVPRDLPADVVGVPARVRSVNACA